MAGFPNIRGAVVLAREDLPGEKQLVAYVTVEKGKAPNSSDLRNLLHASLPDYMIPSAFVTLDEFPLTPYRKVDRLALPRPGRTSYVRGGYEAPIGATEEALARIWSELLGVKRIGRHDDFFDLGGHSLLECCCSRLRHALNIEIPLAELFVRPQLESLSELITDLQLAQFDPDELAEIAGTVKSDAIAKYA